MVRTLGLAAPTAPGDVTASYPPHRPHARLWCGVEATAVPGPHL